MLVVIYHMLSNSPCLLLGVGNGKHCKILNKCVIQKLEDHFYSKKVNGYGRKEIHNLTLLDEFVKNINKFFTLLSSINYLGKDLMVSLVTTMHCK
jgi:hypothetical protein